MQTPEGFQKAGGMRRLWRGLSVTACGSIPQGSIFFGVYETSKSWLAKAGGRGQQSVSSDVSSGSAEVVPAGDLDASGGSKCRGDHYLHCPSAD